MNLKNHKWKKNNFELKPRDKAFHELYGWFFDSKECVKCGLQKITERQGRPYVRTGYETYYFFVDEEGYIKNDELMKGRVPWKCGYREVILLNDSDFEIDF